MSFFDSIMDSLGIESGGIFRAMMISDNSVYIENVKSLVSYSKTEITFNLKKGGMTIKGEELFIKKYCSGDLVVCGKIKQLSLI